MTSCLVTGSTGLLGSYMVDFLLRKGCRVYGIYRARPSRSDEERANLSLLECDLHDSERLATVVSEAKPDLVFHFGAQSFPARSWADPAETLNTNVLGTLHLLEAIRASRQTPAVLVVGSSAEYAESTTSERVSEDSALLPTSPYGVSKLAAGLLAQMYARTYGMRTVLVRPFMAVGPRKIGDACSDFARGIVAIERGERSHISVGNLDPIRDFLDVRDAISAFWLVTQKGDTGEAYNVCSGTGHSMREVLELFCSYGQKPIRTDEDRSRARPGEPSSIVGDNSRLRSLGWEPVIPLKQTVADILDYWRCQP